MVFLFFQFFHSSDEIYRVAPILHWKTYSAHDIYVFTYYMKIYQHGWCPIQLARRIGLRFLCPNVLPVFFSSLCVFSFYFFKVQFTCGLLLLQESLCQVLYTIWEYFQTCVFLWMLVEGIHIHNVIAVSVFPSKRGLWPYHLLAWGKRLLSSTFFCSSKSFQPGRGLVLA